MKKLMIICLMFFVAVGSSNLQAQSISSLRSKVERLTNEVAEQKKDIEAQKKAVDVAQQKVDNKIKDDKEKAKDNPKEHGSNEELSELREELKAANEELDEMEEDLSELEEELEETENKLEEKLKKAVDDIIKKNPIPDDPNELAEYEKKMQKLETNPRNRKTEAELKKRIQERIDAKRKELEEHGALPGSQNQNTFPGSSNWRRISTDESIDKSSEFALGLEYAVWFVKGEKYDDRYFEEIRKEVYSDDQLLEKLMEKLGGEFHIGSFSAPEESFTNYEYKKPQFIGITADFWLNERLAFGAGFAKGKSSISAEFPVTVFNFTEGLTETFGGKLGHSQSVYQTFIYAQYALLIHMIRITMGAGAEYDYFAASEIEAQLGGQYIPIERIDAQANLSPRAQLGIQFELGRRLLLEADLKAKYIDKKVEAGVGVGLQYRFGK